MTSTLSSSNMADADQRDVAIVDGNEGSKVVSESGQPVDEAQDQKSEAASAVGQQEYNAEHNDILEAGVVREEEDQPALGSEKGEDSGTEHGIAELRDHEDEELARESIARAQHDEAANDEPDLSTMDAPALRELVLQMRTQHSQQLHAEERARAEVEDMCLRIEKHFKAEKARQPGLLLGHSLNQTCGITSRKISLKPQGYQSSSGICAGSPSEGRGAHAACN